MARKNIEFQLIFVALYAEKNYVRNTKVKALMYARVLT